ncbi:MAG: hypothetical protein IRZ06_13180 [Nevskia sp.]|nr:hypothetical protein [Nevskia sp.]
MIGMLLGGVAWGLAADRYGRRPILFATIATYSVANQDGSRPASYPEA